MNDAPNLLIEWSSPWDEFRSSLGPALGRSPRKLAGEAHIGLFPYRGMLASFVIEALALAAVIVIPAKLATLRPYMPPQSPKYEVIYYSGNELPKTEDMGGAQTGKSGRAGGKQAHHPTQTIRVARGGTLRDTVVDAPHLKLPLSSSPVANLLAYKPNVGPPPTEGIRSSQRAMQLPETAAVAPAPEVQRDRLQNTPALMASNVAPPMPTAPQRDLRTFQVPGSQAMQVVPPPVSAPEEVSSTKARMTLPAQTVVAPPPTQITRELSPRGPGFGSGELQRQVVPPPVQMSGGALQRQAIGGLNGGQTVIPPPVQMSGGATQRQGTGLGGSVAVVPPPPSVAGGGALNGVGQGNRGRGFGGIMDSGSVAAPPNGGGNGAGNGVVVSSKPGSAVGLPGGGGAGSLAMSPSGGSEPGLGGSGGGTGIGRGNGSGSGFSGEGPGASKEGTGRGAEVNAHGGISPVPGSGGAGSGVDGTPAMAGVAVRGGSNVITLPSFGAGGNDPTTPGRSASGGKGGPGITIVATSRSGGAFNFYGYLKGDKVYTIYIDTTMGPAVLQFADPTSAARPYSEELTAPDTIRADLPGGILRSRLVIACIIDRTGVLKNFQVLEPGNAVTTAKVVAQLPKWKFRPAMRGTEPVEVNAILGFNVDTSDRY